MRSLGLVLIENDWNPYKKRKFGQRQAVMEDHGKTEENVYLSTSQGHRPSKKQPY